MTGPDIIRMVINGKEYEPDDACYFNIEGDDVTIDGHFRPKPEASP